MEWMYGCRGRCQWMGSDETHLLMFDVIVRDEVTRQCPQTTTFLKRKESKSEIEPRSLCLGGD